MSLIKIQKVIYNGSYSEQLLGYAIDMPQKKYETYSLPVQGWILGKKKPLSFALVTDEGGREYARIPLDVPRPDVAAYFGYTPYEEPCGFYHRMNLWGLPAKTVLRIFAVTEDDSRLELATIRLQRTPMPATKNTILDPIILNSIGRTGTTWVMRLLAEHPRIATYKYYPFEGRIASYWLHNVLAAHQHGGEDASSDSLYAINREWMNVHLGIQPSAFQWFQKSYLEQLAAFCKQSIDRCFLECARSDGRALDSKKYTDSPEPLYFAEKFGAGYVPGLIWEIYPNTREILLVRDFRDMHCSIKSFTDKHGRGDAFGVYSHKNEAGFVEHTASRIDLLVKEWQARKDKIYLLRYEDLILEPETTLARILEYLHLDNSSAVITKLLEAASKDPRRIMQGHRTSGDVESSVGRWRKELTQEQQDLLDDKFGRYLTLFGYR